MLRRRRHASRGHAGRLSCSKCKKARRIRLQNILTTGPQLKYGQCISRLFWAKVMVLLLLYRPGGKNPVD